MRRFPGFRSRVAVDDPLLVRRLQPLHELDGEPEDVALRQRGGADLLVEGLAGDPLHHQEVHAPLAVEVVDGGHVRVVEAGERQRLLPEALAHGLVDERARGKDLQGHVAVEPLVVGPVDDTHPTCSDHLQDSELAQGLADHGKRSFVEGSPILGDPVRRRQLR
jgi:hypothetical protein